ncbi:MAG: hypothetical protein ACE5F9_05595 [Phycisphaerae bacterium]
MIGGLSLNDNPSIPNDESRAAPGRETPRGSPAAPSPCRLPPRPGEPAGDLITAETFRGRETTPSAETVGWRRHRLVRLDFVLAAEIILIALLVRWPFIQSGETLLNPDEAIVGLMSMDIAAGDRYPIYFYGQRYMGSLEAYIIAAVSPFFDDPVRALRFGPACVFAVFVAMQFLMLTRWFGRIGGLAGAGMLLACSPMFLHWSISARGGYVEVLLWGTALLWAYSEWFVPPRPRVDNRRRRRRRFALGILIGSGFWINPAIILFIAPIALHALLNRPLAMLESSPRPGGLLVSIRRRLGRTTLPVLAILAVLLVNAIWSVWVDQGRVRYSMLFGLGPSPVAFMVLAAAGAAAALWLIRYTKAVERLRDGIVSNAAVIVGMLVGAAPAVVYMLQTTLGGRPLDPSLPMGLRPLWLTGETMVYLMHGLPLLFGADPRPFVHLMGMGRPDVSQPLGLATSGLLTASNWLVLGALVTTVVVLMATQHRTLARLLRLQSVILPPSMLLLLSCVVAVSLYVLGGCTMNFTTIRYLVPLWAFVPGLLASTFIARRFRPAGAVAVVFLCAGYVFGQTAMHAQLGAPHPLRALASALEERGIDRGLAEPLDAHLLSFMTARRCRLAEFESFWVRFPHHRALLDADRPVDYIVDTSATEWTTPWTHAGWPGWPPPQTMRFLWPKLRRAIMIDPSLLLHRERLTPGYELIRLRQPLSERKF